jgi:peptidoglycan/LPS O-acetylase OafA/YrhL
MSSGTNREGHLPSPKPPPRLQALDILRGVAILLVLGHHARRDGPPAILQPWIDGGWMGVDLFFVLSGFLVSGLLFKEHKRHGDVRLGRFLVRRGFKIYPAFYVFLFSTSLLAGFGAHAIDLPALLSEALFVQNYGPNLKDHTWSLAVEEHFYLLLCLYFWLQLRRSRAQPFASLPVLFVLVAVACLGLRLWTTWSAPFPYTDNNKHLHFPTHLRLDSLLFGVLLSYWYHFHQDGLAQRIEGRKLALLFIGIGLVAPCFFQDINTSFYDHTIGLTLNYLGFGAILLAALYWQPTRSRWSGLAWTLLAAIGFYSYSIYLWHMELEKWSWTALALLAGRSGTGPPYLLALAVYVLTALIGGALMAKMIETPFLRLRDRWFPSRSLPMNGKSSA